MKTIQLTQGQVALVDDEDFEYLNQWKWYAVKGACTYYAQRYGYINDHKQKCIFMHRQILGLKPNDGILSDHINGNGLDNRKMNLRKCNVKQNCRNRQSHNKHSRYIGVRREWNKWRASIQANKKFCHIGMYSTEQEAAKAYDDKAKKIYGEFARLNFPSSRPYCEGVKQ